MAASRNKPSRTAPHQVRIIGGQWKRTPLPVLDAEGLRPTPDRVRETVFNWLTHLFHGEWENKACLDMFAGTGAMGFEAASRGAAEVVMIEHNARAVHQLQANQEKLHATQVKILHGDVTRRITSLPQQAFHVIFLDPPYGQDWLPRILPQCLLLLVPGGLVYAEAEQAFGPEALPDWDIIRADKAGIVFYHLLQCRNT